MTKKVLLFACLLSISVFAQKAQRIGFIDMQYILENIPEYSAAQSQLNAKAISWQTSIDAKQKEIDVLKAELINERTLLTKTLIEEKEEDIEIKELELKKMQETYFGPNGDLYILRQQLVKPIQDLVYNAVQDIAAKRKYDFILDKSSDLIMLYTNNQFDVSELVLNTIVRNQKTEAVKNKQQGNIEVINTGNQIDNVSTDANNEVEEINEIETEEQNLDESITEIKENSDLKTIDSASVKLEEEKVLNSRDAKKAELQKKIAERKAQQLKKREELKKAIEEKRLKRIQEIEQAKKEKEEKKENNN
jgi:Skp family chaperone for outer membrane proteins